MCFFMSWCVYFYDAKAPHLRELIETFFADILSPEDLDTIILHIAMAMVEKSCNN